MIRLQNGITGTSCARKKEKRKREKFTPACTKHSEITPLDTHAGGTTAVLQSQVLCVAAHVENMLLL